MTITGGKGNDDIHLNSNAEKNLIRYRADDGNDTLYGFDGNDTLSISGGSYSTQESGNDLLVNVGKGTIRLKNAYARADTIHINKKSVALKKKTVQLSKSENIIVNRNSISVVGSAGKDSIQNNADNVTITGGKGKDWISLNGSADNTLIKYAAGDGNDTLYGFDGNDTLSISGGSYSTQASGKDLLVKVGKETIRLKNAYALADTIHINKKSVALKKKTVQSADGEDIIVKRSSISVVGSAGNDYIENFGNKVTITGGDGDDFISNEGGDKVSLYGGAGNDYLSGGSGQSTLWGGTGNDELCGGEGKDIFVYKPGEGTDQIFNYSGGDMLKILKSNGKSGGTFTKSKYSDGTLSLTVSGGGQVIFDDVSTSTNFNINGTSYKISGSKLVKK